MVKRVLLASPRGYCAGVERAVETVERALDHYGAPVYVRKQIVHNIHVVRDLEARGAIFVEEETEVPPDATVVYSAHGVAPSVFENSERLGHNVIDAVCPLVTKVHVQARRYAEDGYTIVLIGHAGPRGGRRDDRRGARRDDPRADGRRGGGARPPTGHEARLRDADDAVGRRDGRDHLHAQPAVPGHPRPPQGGHLLRDLQPAVGRQGDALRRSTCCSSSGRATRRTRTASWRRPATAGTPSYLIDDETEIDPSWLDGCETVGITSGASAPEKLVARVCAWFEARGVTDIESYRLVEEDVTFRLPVELRRELELASRT